MTVKKLREALAAYPDDMVVVFDEFESDMEFYNFIQASYLGEDNKVHLYEE